MISEHRSDNARDLLYGQGLLSVFVLIQRSHNTGSVLPVMREGTVSGKYSTCSLHLRIDILAYAAGDEGGYSVW